MPSAFKSIRSFSGGMNERLSARDLPDNQVVEAVNLTQDKAGTYQVREGIERVNDPLSLLPTAPIGTHKYYPASGSPQIIAVCSDGTIHKLETDTWSQIASGVQVGARAEFAEGDGFLYIVTGQGPMLRWNGTTFRTTTGIEAPESAPILTVDTSPQTLSSPNPFPNNRSRMTYIEGFEDELYLAVPGSSTWQRYSVDGNSWSTHQPIPQTPFTQGMEIVGLADGDSVLYFKGYAGGSDWNNWAASQVYYRYRRSNNSWTLIPPNSDTTGDGGPGKEERGNNRWNYYFVTDGTHAYRPPWSSSVFLTLARRRVIDVGQGQSSWTYIIAYWDPDIGFTGISNNYREFFPPVQIDNGTALPTGYKMQITATDTAGLVYILFQDPSEAPFNQCRFFRYDYFNNILLRLADVPIPGGLSDDYTFIYPHGLAQTGQLEYLYLLRTTDPELMIYDIGAATWTTQSLTNTGTIGPPAIAPGTDSRYYHFERTPDAFVSQTFSGGNFPTALYRYGYTFGDGSNESNLSPTADASAPIGAPIRMDFSTGPGYVTERFLYRSSDFSDTPSGSPQLLRLHYVNDNLTTTYTDPPATDESLGPEVPPTSNDPGRTGASIIAYQAGRLFLAGFNDEPTLVVWSNIDNIENFDPLNYRYFKRGDGDILTALVPLDLDMMTIFKSSSMWTLSGEPDDNYSWRKISDRIGAVAGRSVATAEGYQYFLADDGVYQFNGSRPMLISDRLTDRIRSLTQAQRAVAQGVYFRDRYLFALVDPNTDPNNNSIVFEWDTRLENAGAWSAYHTVPVREWVRVQGQEDNADLLFIPVATNELYRWASGTTDLGAAITWQLVTKAEDLGDQLLDKQFRRLWITANIPTDKDITATYTMDEGRTSAALPVISPIVPYRQESYFIPLPSECVGNNMQLTLTGSSGLERMVLDGYDIEYRVYPRRRGRRT